MTSVESFHRHCRLEYASPTLGLMGVWQKVLSNLAYLMDVVTHPIMSLIQFLFHHTFRKAFSLPPSLGALLRGGAMQVVATSIL